MNSAANPIIGIDLGTTFSVIAHLDPAGRPVTLLNSEGDALTPSVVLFDRSSIIVGKEAAKAAVLEPDRVIQFIKREIGNPLSSQAIDGDRIPPEVVESLILEKLKKDAERIVGPITSAVITVPAYFNEPRRKATQDAGRLAGLEVLDILNEPTAAAIAYGLQAGVLNARGESQPVERILVYDLGGGTFDVTLVEIAGRDFRAIATAGDVYLGGIDWDRRLAEFIAEQFRNRHRGIDPLSEPGGVQRLLRESEDAKRALTFREQTTVTLEYLGHGLRLDVSRSQFESLTADLLERTRLTLRTVLRESGFAWKDLTRVLLVGGSIRMPMVRRMIEEEAGMKPDVSLSADEAVAHGAALYAGLLHGQAARRPAQTRVSNVSSHDLGVLAREPGTGRPRNSVVIPHNTPLPAAKRRLFKTARANQRSVAVNVIEGGDSSGQNSTSIGSCRIADLPAGLPAGTPVEVEFQYTQNGRLTVLARLPTLNKEASIDLDRSSGLNETQLNAWGDRLRAQWGGVQG